MCVAEWGAGTHLLTRYRIKNKSWQVTSWMPGTGWAAGQGSRSLSLDRFRSPAQEMLNIKGHGLNCPVYTWQGDGQRPYTWLRGGQASQRRLPLSYTLLLSQLGPGATKWVGFGHCSPLTPGWDPGSGDGSHQRTQQLCSLPTPCPGPEDASAEGLCTQMVLQLSAPSSPSATLMNIAGATSRALSALWPQTTDRFKQRRYIQTPKLLQNTPSTAPEGLFLAAASSETGQRLPP